MKKILLLNLVLLLTGVLSAQTIVPTQTDEIILDNGTSGQADAGDKIRYKVTIINSGGTEGTGVQLNVTPDVLTTLVPGSFKSSPVAIEDAYACTGNVGISVPASNGPLINDFDDDIAGLTVIPAAGGTTQGGAFAIGADGSFSYSPPAGFTGMDMFNYTLNDGNPVGGSIPMTDMGVVIITVSNMIWFVDNTGGGLGGTGTLTSPFKTLGDFNSSILPSSGQVVFIKNTGTNYPGGIVLESNQFLFGSGHPGGSNLADPGVLPFAIASSSQTLPPINGTRPVLTNSSGVGILLASGNTVRGLNVGTCSGFGIDDNGNIGTLNISEVSINNTSGGGLRTASGGTINYTGIGNTITTTTNTAVNITNTTIGGSGVTMETISMDAGNGINTAIILSSTGAGTFTVTGVGTTDGSGGTIENILADAITLKNVGGRVTLKNVIIENIGSTSGTINTQSGHDAIHTEQLNGGLTLNNVTIRRISDNAILGRLFNPVPLPPPGGGAVIATIFDGLEIIDCLIEDTNRFHVANAGDDSDEGTIRIIGLTGTVLIQNSTIRRGGELLDIQSHTSGALNITIQGCTFNNSFKEFTSGGIANVGKTGIDINILGSNNATIIIGDPAETNPVLGNTFMDCATASISVVTTIDNTASFMPTGTSSATISRNTFLVTDHSSALGSTGNFPQGGVLFRTGNGPGTLNTIFSHNTFGSFDGVTTSNECMNAAGGTGNLVLLYDTGGGNVRVESNTFNGPINAAWWFTAENSATVTVLLKNNVYRSNPNFFSPDPGFGTFNVPGIPSETRVRNNGIMNLTIRDEDHAPHELRTCCCCCGGCSEQTTRFTTQSSGGTLNLFCKNVDAPNGFDLTMLGGTFNLFRDMSSSSDPQTILDDNQCTGGGTAFGGTPGQTPPTVEVNGTITAQNGTPALPGI